MFLHEHLLYANQCIKFYTKASYYLIKLFQQLWDVQYDLTFTDGYQNQNQLWIND